jgi:hypothetical protein
MTLTSGIPLYLVDTGVMLREVACPGARAQQIGMENANFSAPAQRRGGGGRRGPTRTWDSGHGGPCWRRAPAPPAGARGGLGGRFSSSSSLDEELAPPSTSSRLFALSWTAPPRALAVAAGTGFKGRRRLRAQGARLGAWARGSPWWVPRTSRATRSSW